LSAPQHKELSILRVLDEKTREWVYDRAVLRRTFRVEEEELGPGGAIKRWKEGGEKRVEDEDDEEDEEDDDDLSAKIVRAGQQAVTTASEYPWGPTAFMDGAVRERFQSLDANSLESDDVDNLHKVGSTRILFV
jgi:hypothetical protein